MYPGCSYSLKRQASTILVALLLSVFSAKLGWADGPPTSSAAASDVLVPGNSTLPPAEPSSSGGDFFDACPSSAADGQHCGLLDNLSVFAGLDGSKGPQDLGISANFGGRAAVNWAYPLLEQYGLGVQIGTAVNYSRTATTVLELVEGPPERTQNFTTVGLFERTDFGLKVGLVYDYLYEHYYSHIDVSQWRGVIGYDLTPCDEIGVWGTKGDRGQGTTFAGLDLHLRPVTQGSVYWRHTWPSHVETGFWFGVAEEHGRFVLVDIGRPNIHHPIEFGADLYMPLGERLAIFGEANFITPNDTGTVDATLGFVYYFGKGAEAHGSRFAPLLPVANNPTFTVDLQQQ